MQINQVSKILAEMYENAKPKEQLLAIHLFGIKFADELERLSANEIALKAKSFKSYGTEIRKGMRLAKHVKVLNE